MKQLLIAFAALVAFDVGAATRCDDMRAKLGANLVNCWDFERADDALLQSPGEPGSVTSEFVTIDTAQKASGNSSLRFETISYRTAQQRCPTCSVEENRRTAQRSNTQWVGRNFSPDYSRQFGRGQEFWVQFRVLDSDTAFTSRMGGDGMKKIIVGAGDRWIDFRSTLREPLALGAGKGALIKLAGGDPVAGMPRFGYMQIDGELITYHGLNVAESAVVILARGRGMADHAAGAATHVRHEQRAPGCSDLEIPVTAGWNHIPRSYHSCGVKRLAPTDKAGQYEGHSYRGPTPYAASDWIWQAGRRGTWNEARKRWEGGCYLSRVNKGDFTGCVSDGPGQGWVIWTMQVIPGPAWYRNDYRFAHGATVRLWRNDALVTELSPDLQHPRLNAPSAAECVAKYASASMMNAVDCIGGYDLYRGAVTLPSTSLTGPMSLSDSGGLYGKLWLNHQSWERQNKTEADPYFCCHETVYRWYDDVVVSRVDPGLPDGRPLLVKPLALGAVDVSGGVPPYTVTVRDRAGTTVERVQ